MRAHFLLSSLLLLPACAPEASAGALRCPPEAPVSASKASPPAPSVTGAPVLDAPLAPYGFLLGQWDAPPSPTGSGAYSFEPEAQGHVIVRRNTSNTPKGKHDDVLMMYVAPQGGVRALYADNEGHIIEYAVTATDNPKRAVFLSNESPGAPRFRLSYWPNADGSVGGRFEMAPPGATEFKRYLDWSATKK
jgi:hypothetical protein